MENLEDFITPENYHGPPPKKRHIDFKEHHFLSIHLHFWDSSQPLIVQQPRIELPAKISVDHHGRFPGHDACADTRAKR